MLIQIGSNLREERKANIAIHESTTDALKARRESLLKKEQTA
jgi:hypothetical protein